MVIKRTPPKILPTETRISASTPTNAPIKSPDPLPRATKVTLFNNIFQFNYPAKVYDMLKYFEIFVNDLAK